MARWGTAGLVVALAAVAAGGGCRQTPAVEEIYILAERGPDGLDPHTAGSVFQTRNILFNVYEGLVGFDADMRLAPALATAWSSPDEHTWEFTLRQGVRFHDGRTMTASDVVWSLERARTDPASTLRGALASVTRTTAVDARTVRLHLSEADASLPHRLRAVAILSQATAVGRLAQASTGSGPYRLAKSRGDEVTLERFADHWRGPAAVGRGVYLPLAWGDPRLAQRVPAGAPVVFWTRPGNDLARSAERKATLVRWARPGIVYLGFDLRPAAPGAGPNPLLDVRVRKAIALAIDYDELLRVAVDDQGVAATQLVAPFVYGFDSELPPPRRDLAAARALLAEAGQATPLALPLYSRELMPVYGAVLARQLAEAGLRVEPHLLDEAPFFARIGAATGGLYVLRFTCRTGDAQEFFDAWAHTPDPARGLGLSNYSFTASPFVGLDEEIRAARRDTAPGSRLARLRALNRRLIEEQAAIPLLVPQGQIFVSHRLDWTPRTDGFWLLEGFHPTAH